jgi:hypothetical protein
MQRTCTPGQSTAKHGTNHLSSVNMITGHYCVCGGGVASKPNREAENRLNVPIVLQKPSVYQLNQLVGAATKTWHHVM